MSISKLVKTTKEYEYIQNFYGDKDNHEGKKSEHGIPLMVHIDQGLTILDNLVRVRGVRWLILNKIDIAQAFCLHPLFQEDDQLRRVYPVNIDKLQSYTVFLVMEYRNIANQYLSRHYPRDMPDIKLSPIAEVNTMLIMDKVQNYWNLRKHRQDHENYSDLLGYLESWLRRLGISMDLYEQLTEGL